MALPRALLASIQIPSCQGPDRKYQKSLSRFKSFRAEAEQQLLNLKMDIGLLIFVEDNKTNRRAIKERTNERTRMIERSKECAWF